MTDDPKKQAEKRLRSIVGRWRDAQRKETEWQEATYDALVDAADAGVSWADLVEISGLSRQRVGQVLQERRASRASA